MFLDEWANIKDKTDQEYKREGKVLVRDEIEDEIMRKYKDNKDRKWGEKVEEKFRHLPKQAVIDDMFDQNKFSTSVAEQKRVWKGNRGRFDKSDITSWYRIVNHSKLKMHFGSLATIKKLHAYRN